VLTAAAPSLTWTYKSGNIWAAQLPAAPASATVLNMQFGSLWGQYKAPSTTCLTAGVIVNPQDFCSYAGYVYVYDSSATNGPAAFYGTTVTPILTLASGYQLISVSSKKWLTFQHLRLQNFDSIGVLVWAASDNLIFANMEVDGGVPSSTNPLGFYINATSPASIQFYNVEVRTHDYGWGPSNDRNLLGRFSGRVFSLPRLGRTQNYFLRLYDTASPPRYSRYAAALHVDYPL
jgi:hypothetical protein